MSAGRAPPPGKKREEYIITSRTDSILGGFGVTFDRLPHSPPLLVADLEPRKKVGDGGFWLLGSGGRVFGAA